jgi:hypothetical protein
MADIEVSLARENPGQTIVWEQVNAVVGILQGLYGFGLVLGSLAIVVALAIFGPSKYSIGQWACIGLGLEAYIFTYLGLLLRKPWVVPLIVFGSAYCMIPCLAMQPQTLTSTIIDRALAAFSLFQLWFFTRAGTVRYFSTQGTTLF